MFCRECGKQIDDHSKFCSFCGCSMESSKGGDSLVNKGIDTGTYGELPEDENQKKIKRRGALKKVGVFFMILGIVVGAGGYIASSELADGYQGVSARTGYYNSSGNYVATNSGKIGGNSAAVEHYETMSVIFMCCGIFITVLGFIYFAAGVSGNSQNSGGSQNKRKK